MSFYSKYRLPILLTTTVLSSVFLAIAIDKIMKIKAKKNNKQIN